MPDSDKVVALRRLLDERFPAARRREARTIPTGVRCVDALLKGGLVTGAITEFVSSVASGGSQLSVASIVLLTRTARQRIVIVDAVDGFGLDGLDDDAVSHLVWIRSRNLSETWRAADLVARDPNYAVIVVDVRGFPERELLRTKDSVWVRLQRAAEHAETALVVQSTTPIVPNAAMRLTFSEPLSPASLTRPRVELLDDVRVELQRSRMRARESSA